MLEPGDDAYRRLVASMQDHAIFMLDRAGHVRSWNEGARGTFGYAADEVLGRHVSMFDPEEDVRAGKCERELAVASSDGRLEDLGWRIRKDGSRFFANVVITALRDDTGRLIGFSKVTRDVTERRRAEEQLRQSEEQFRLL